MMEVPKLSNFKIGGPILQNGKNRGTKTVIKPTYYLFYIISIYGY